MVLLAPYVYQASHKDNTINFKAFDKATVGTDKTGSIIADDSAFTGDSRIPPAVLFKFNPNHLPLADWVKLGLTEHQAVVVKHYEEKGGLFFTVKIKIKRVVVMCRHPYTVDHPFAFRFKKHQGTIRIFTGKRIFSAKTVVVAARGIVG